jgi:CRP-like cAMP-binding protein
MTQPAELIRSNGFAAIDGEEPWSANGLLQRIPAEEIAALSPHLEEVEVCSRDLIMEPGSEITWVHFPMSCVISLVTVVDGGGIEALTVGREGMTGLPLLRGARTTFARTIGQIPGRALRINAHDFARILPDVPVLHRRALLYSQLAFDATSQSAACNRLHVTEERCARWLLMSQDRAARDEFELTQTFLAQMLGVRRPAVTVAIGVLEKAGLIEHRRARIRVADRGGLEAAACECYRLIRERSKELLGE